MSDLQGWLEEMKYLPVFMRDFHDQKDLFKCIHDRIEPSPDDISWRQGHCYVIDKFLWFMARRGYTLQKNRSRLPFKDISEDVEKSKQIRMEQFDALLTPLAGGIEHE